MEAIRISFRPRGGPPKKKTKLSGIRSQTGAQGVPLPVTASARLERPVQLSDTLAVESEGSDGLRSLLTFAKALFSQQLASIHCLRVLPSGRQVSGSEGKIIFFYANSLNVAFLAVPVLAAAFVVHSRRESFDRRTRWRARPRTRKPSALSGLSCGHTWLPMDLTCSRPRSRRLRRLGRRRRAHHPLARGRPVAAVAVTRSRSTERFQREHPARRRTRDRVR